MVTELEQLIDELDTEVELPPSFILPGASPGSAILDLARTTLREAERRILDLEELGQLVNKQILPYVNRLSDLLFMLARYEDKDLPNELITGQKINE
jgi:cob(I)alamin adenosyltransferase